MRKILKYDVNFKNKHYKYNTGAVSINLENVEDMKATIIADWSYDYAQKRLLDVLEYCTGIGGGWTFPFITAKKEGKMFIYEMLISSRLYKNLRSIYER